MNAARLRADAIALGAAKLHDLRVIFQQRRINAAAIADCTGQLVKVWLFCVEVRRTAAQQAGFSEV